MSKSNIHNFHLLVFALIAAMHRKIYKDEIEIKNVKSPIKIKQLTFCSIQV